MTGDSYDRWYLYATTASHVVCMSTASYVPRPYPQTRVNWNCPGCGAPYTGKAKCEWCGRHV